MPLDMIPENLDFGIGYEPTKVADKKYVINTNTGEYLGVVGNDFNTETHTKFFNKVQDTMLEKLSPYEVEGAAVNWKSAKNNAWALMDITLPNVTTKITTDKHETTVAQRIISLRAVDGSCSNQVFFGAIDFFCTNGMIRGEHDKVRRKNTSGFSVENFANQLRKSNEDFQMQTKRLQEWANKPLLVADVKAMLESLLKADRMADKMFSLYNQEASVRGQNVWALYSAFTNYASYADERNGFNMRNTGRDTNSQRMFDREHKVSRWVESKEFKELIAA